MYRWENFLEKIERICTFIRQVRVGYYSSQWSKRHFFAKFQNFAKIYQKVPTCITKNTPRYFCSSTNTLGFNPSVMGAGRKHEVLKSADSISKMSRFFKEAQFEQTSRLRPKPPPIPQYSPMGGLTCDIGRGFGRSLEHGFISTLKLVVKLYYRNAQCCHFAPFHTSFCKMWQKWTNSCVLLRLRCNVSQISPKQPKTASRCSI